jgi:hypothetical protein
MKILRLSLLALSLTALYSCESKTSSKSESCSFNDKPVSCEFLKSKPAEQSPLEAVSLSATVEAQINIFDTKYDVLESTNKTAEKVVGERYYDCRAQTFAEDTIEYKASKKELLINYEGVIHTYGRLTNEESGLMGSWQNKSREKNAEVITTLTFSTKTMIVTSQCNFYKTINH